MVNKIKKIRFVRPLKDENNKTIKVVERQKKYLKPELIYEFEVCGIKFKMFPNKKNCKLWDMNNYFISGKYPRENSKNYLIATINFYHIEITLKKKGRASFKLDQKLYNTEQLKAYCDIRFKDYEKRIGVKGFVAYVKEHFGDEIK